VNNLSVVVSDAGPLIHLDEIGCLDLLEDFNRVVVPATVRDEVVAYRGIDFTRTPLDVIPDPPEDMPVTAVCRSLCLHAGERAALAACRAMRCGLFLTDDIAARLAAVQLGINVHGTIGILLRAVRREQRNREEMIHLLEELPSRSSLFIKQTLIDRAVAELRSYQA